MAAIVAIVVFRKVAPVSPWNWAEKPPQAFFESSVKTIEPTLKPYQPNQSRPAPIIVSVRLCGRDVSRGQPTRLPMIRARMPPAIPALM